MQSLRITQDKQKDNYRFEVDNSSEANPIDWYNAYLEVDFKLVKLADGAAFDVAVDDANSCTTTNGQTFVKEIQVECNGITVYNNTRANESSNVLSMLKYTKSYADTVGKDQFFFPLIHQQELQNQIQKLLGAPIMKVLAKEKL